MWRTIAKFGRTLKILFIASIPASISKPIKVRALAASILCSLSVHPTSKGTFLSWNKTVLYKFVLVSLKLFEHLFPLPVWHCSKPYVEGPLVV